MKCLPTFLTHLHCTPTGDHHAPHIHLVTRGVGLAPVNAMCSNYLVESVRGGRTFRSRYSRGLLADREADPILNFSRGTRLRLDLDRELWRAGFAKGGLRRRLFDLVHLIPRMTVALNREVFHSEHGLLDMAQFELNELPDPCFGYRGQSETVIVNAAFTGQLGQRSSHPRAWQPCRRPRQL